MTGPLQHTTLSLSPGNGAEAVVYPFYSTQQGRAYLDMLNVRDDACRWEREELKRYAYCVCAGAAREAGLEFEYTIKDFIAACERDWASKAEQLLTENNQPTKRAKKSIKKDDTENNNDSDCG